jgi:hypothetical protein
MVPELIRIDRRGVRRRFEQRFSAQRMASDYLAVYRNLIGDAEAAYAQNRLPSSPNVIRLPRRAALGQHAN